MTDRRSQKRLDTEFTEDSQRPQRTPAPVGFDLCALCETLVTSVLSFLLAAVPGFGVKDQTHYDVTQFRSDP